MVVTYVAEPWRVADRIVQVHGSATRHQETVADVVALYQMLKYEVTNFYHVAMYI